MRCNMNSIKQQVKEILASILYIDSPQSIKDSDSLFLDLNLNSIDVIDFVFELNQKFNIELKDNELWPIRTWIDNPNYFTDGKWTESGIEAIKRELSIQEEISNDVSQKDLLRYFTVDYIANRINQKMNG